MNIKKIISRFFYAEKNHPRPPHKHLSQKTHFKAFAASMASDALRTWLAESDDPAAVESNKQAMQEAVDQLSSQHRRQCMMGAAAYVDQCNKEKHKLLEHIKATGTGMSDAQFAELEKKRRGVIDGLMAKWILAPVDSDDDGILLEELEQEEDTCAEGGSSDGDDDGDGDSKSSDNELGEAIEAVIDARKCGLEVDTDEGRRYMQRHMVRHRQHLPPCLPDLTLAKLADMGHGSSRDDETIPLQYSDFSSRGNMRGRDVSPVRKTHRTEEEIEARKAELQRRIARYIKQPRKATQHRINTANIARAVQLARTSTALITGIENACKECGLDDKNQLSWDQVHNVLAPILARGECVIRL